ncbi:MAG: nitroreductase [Oceanospirillaceae bacterium]|nr:nitroreductase [Oceanospirillaceae bacterium]MBT13661.1 nitroreductase [Oceanospirillaceae bacterium]|tara:strand:+ start:65965 stop:67611 length:1647 start_codon:yes stop_codon:yes gene_type:complete
MDILSYHQRSKHRPDAYARGPESIDWDAQPDPFRTFEAPDDAGRSARQIPLPLTASGIGRRWSELWRTEHRQEWVTPDRETLANLLELSLALSAWKQFGSARWSLRVNPSSGNLHPTECYVVATNIAGLEDGIYHYRADTHALEQRCRFIEKATDHTPLLWLGFTSVHWREAWKYGERAYRYCQLDTGHALAAVSYAAATIGFSAHQIVPLTVQDNKLADLLGISREQDFTNPGGQAAEREHGDCLLSLTGRQGLDTLLFQANHGDWCGRANVLDSRHFYQWPVIDEAVASALKTKPDSAAPDAYYTDQAPMPARGVLADEPAARLIKQRRSAQKFDPAGSIRQEDFYTLLDHCLARAEVPPWNVLQQAADVHLFIFAHNVEGLDSGLYTLLRSPAADEVLPPALRDAFVWQKPATAPQHLHFYQLLKAGTRRTAANLSCQQAIAGESAFSVAMLADMNDVKNNHWLYRQRFWQAGVLGQVLYLEAEAAGLRGTGIGCYYDDFVHDLLGLEGTQASWQVLYHFTLGKPEVDHRITQWRPYSERTPAAQ